MKESLNNTKVINMDCEKASELMMKYFDHDINDIENAQLKIHLKDCDICRSGFEALSQALADVEEDALNILPKEGFEKRVMFKISTFEKEKEKDYERTLAFLYTTATIAITFIGLFIFMVSQDEKLYHMWQSIKEIFGPVNSFSGFMLGITQIGVAIAKAVYVGVTQLLRMILVQYSYIVVAFLLMIFGLQQSYIKYMNRNVSKVKEGL